MWGCVVLVCDTLLRSILQYTISGKLRVHLVKYLIGFCYVIGVILFNRSSTGAASFLNGISWENTKISLLL